MTSLLEDKPSIAKRDHHRPIIKTIRIGLLGCGRVGAAVARWCASPPAWLARSGLRLEIVQTLVRDARRHRPGVPDDLKRVDDANAFLAGAYDVVVEALGGIDAPRSLITRLLRAGIPVVTANKALVAAHGTELRRLAWENDVAFRFEAAAIPGAAFLDAIASPCFAAGQIGFVGILNGTCQHILTRIEREPIELRDALRRAIDAGFAEPDPSFDIEGLDAANKLTLILHQLGHVGGTPDAVDRRSLRIVTPGVIRAAAALDGCIRQVALARLCGDGIETYAGPALVERRHTLARLGSRENGIVFRDAAGHATTFAGVGAGPEATARCLIDDVIRAVSPGAAEVGGFEDATTTGSTALPLEAPWFVYVAAAGSDERWSEASRVLSTFDIAIRRMAVVGGRSGRTGTAAITESCDATRIENAADAVRAAVGGEVIALPFIAEETDDC